MIYQNRGKWCIKLPSGIKKFKTQAEAMKFAMSLELETADEAKGPILQYQPEEEEGDQPLEEEIDDQPESLELDEDWFQEEKESWQ